MPAASKSKKATVEQGADDSGIVVTNQQSRFHVDADDAPTSKEVDVRDLTISVGGREIVDHVHLLLKEGGRYALVGRNGLGKSTIMKALAERRIPGVPSNLRVLLLGQTRSSTDENEGPEGTNTNQTVIEYVVKSDKRRERLLRESNGKRDRRLLRCGTDSTKHSQPLWRASQTRLSISWAPRDRSKSITHVEIFMWHNS